MKIKKFFNIVFVISLLGFGAHSLTEKIVAQSWQFDTGYLCEDYFGRPCLAIDRTCPGAFGPPSGPCAPVGATCGYPAGGVFETFECMY
ncbi:MAG: hypothetical protein ACK5W9_05145 [Bdellovibrionales bacterium]